MSTGPAVGALTLSPELRQGYARVLEDRFGLRLTPPLARDLERAVTELVHTNGYRDAQQCYEDLALGSPGDLGEDLAARLTVGETHFFRVGPQLDALRKVVLPDILQRRAPERALRIWSAGCSTGEEPYTVAILLREHLGGREGWRIDLLATDISRPALEAARRAVYGQWSFRDTPEDIRETCFTPMARGWRLRDPVRQMVRFAHLNLVSDPFPSPGAAGPDLDLILCRNVTLYFSAEATQRVYRRFSEALVPEGWLVLGPSDPVPEASLPFHPVYVPGAVLWRRAGLAEAQPLAPSPSPPRKALAHRVAAPRSRQPTAAALPAPPAQDVPPDIQQVWALMKKDRKAALEQAQRLSRASPLALEAHLLLGLLCLDEGDFQRAVQSLRRATFLDPRHPLAQFALGRAHAQLGELASAESALVQARRVLAATPDGEVLAAGDGTRAGELRQAVDTELAMVRRGREI